MKIANQSRYWLLVLLTMLSVGAWAQQKNVLSVPDAKVSIGTSQLPVLIENTDEIIAAQFDLTLPSTISAGSEAALTNRCDGHTVIIRKMEATRYRVMLYSDENRTLLGQQGTVLYIPLNIPQTVTEGSELPLVISNATLSVAGGANVLTDTKAGRLIVSSLPDLTVKAVAGSVSDGSPVGTITPGERLSLSWQVQNVGGAATTGGWSEQLLLVNKRGTVTRLMATTYCQETLAAGASLSRQADITVPQLLGIEGEAYVQVHVIANSDTGESSLATGNNTAQSDETFTVAKRLFVEPSPATVPENYGRNIAVKVSRSGDWSGEQTFALSATDDSRVRGGLPASVTIPAGQSGAVVYMTVTDNSVLDDNGTIVITATGNSYPDGTGQLVIEDNEYPDLTLTASKSVITEGETFQLTVTTSRAVEGSPLDITLTAEAPKRFSFPQTVTIPVGETSATVEVTATDDDVPSLDLSNAFTASASNHNKAEVIVLLKDNDLPVLELQLTPTTVQESAGVVAVAGVLRRTTNTNSKITVKLTDDADGGLYFGNRTLVLDKGVEEVHFNFGPVDNAIVDGDRTYTITAAVWLSSCSCGATGESAGYVEAQLQVLDNDGAALGITSSLSTVKEGGKTTLTVTRNTTENVQGGLPALTVTLSSDYDEGLTYDHTVTIPAGQQSATVEVTSAANSVQGDSHTVIFTAGAEGYAKGTCYLMVTDQTLPDARISDIAAVSVPDGLPVESQEVGTKVKLTITVSNDGAAEMPAEVPVKIYLRGNSTAVGTVYTSEAIAIGGSQTVTKTITLPTTVGSHSYYAVVNEQNTVQELSYNNNTSADVSITTVSPFAITVSTDKTIYKQGDKVTITGQLTGNSIAETDIDIYLINEGARQVQTVKTDANGAFTYEWQLYALQSGHFAVGACYPGEGLDTEMAAFDVYGLKRTEYSNITCETLVGEAYNGSIGLTNPGILDLNNVHVDVIDKPEHISATFSTIEKMTGGAMQSLSFTLNSSELSPSSDWEKIKARILTNEGPSVDVTIYYHNASPRAVLESDISLINTTMTMGESQEFSFYITNTGKGATGNITLGLPSWMKTATAANISSLDYGKSTRVVLRFTTNDDMQLNVPLTGHISINCENGNGITIPYTVKPVSEARGMMVVDVTDEYTYLTEEKPHVENAHVVVNQPVTGEKVAEGNTDADGLFKAELPAGYYTVSVTADKHDSYTNSIMVAPGTDTPVDVFLSFQAITYSWDVVETEVEDVYDIKTTVEYDTRVPKPVVVVNFPDELPYQNQIINLLITNKGLISAYNVGFDAQIDRDGATFEPLVSLPIDTLKPQMTVAIPILMTVNSDLSYNSQGGVSFGGSYYGEDNVENASPEQSRPLRDIEIEETSPGCWKITMTASHDRKECNKKTGEWETVGTDYTSRTWRYGQCGGDPGSGPSGPGWWWNWDWPTWHPQTPPSPNPPTDPPTDKKKPKEDNNNQRTSVFDGCTTDCEDSAAKLPASCAAAAGGCIPDPTFTIWAASCATGLGAGCSGVDDLWDVGDCVLAGVGCIPGPVGCVAGAIGCLSSLGHVYVDCYKNRPKKAPMRGQSEANSKSVSKETYERIFIVYGADSVALEKLYYVLGKGDWDGLQGTDFDLIRSYLFDNMNKEGVILSDNRYDFKPESIDEEQFDYFLKRLDRSIKKYNNPSLDCQDYIDIERIRQLENEFDQYNAEAVAEGYSGIQELADSVCSYYKHLIRLGEEGGSSSVCASITLQFKQTMTMTRQAFRGTLKVYNGHPTESMTDVKLNLEVKDANGNVATAHEFQINPESLDGFSGELSFESGWTLEGDSNGTATVLFIPTKYAAPEEPMEWSFGGTLTYMDPFTGLEVTRTLAPVTLTVKPSPELDLTYFMQRDVYGDDALTLDVVEPMKPAEFALMINNKGYGDATNVRMVTQQPEIIENEKGLYIDFELISSQVNGGEAALSFGQSIANDFGTIPAHSQMYAQWWLTSTLLGHFTDYKVEATHVTSYGNEDLSLLDQVTIHELIHGFDYTAGTVSGGLPAGRAFLVNDIADANDLPDKLYFTNGDTASVAQSVTASIVRKSNTECELTITPSAAGWNYGSVLDPTHGYAELKSIVRKSDGKELGNTRFWQTDRTLRDGKDWLYECRLHFVDDFATGGSQTYVLTFDPVPETVLAVQNIGPVPAEGEIAEEPIEALTVTFNKEINAETFTGDDITFAVQGVKKDANQIGISTEDNKQFKLDMSAMNDTLSNGYYTMTVQTADITDAEGYKGKVGKQTSWILFRGGLIVLNTAVWPEKAGNINFSFEQPAGARRAEANDDAEDGTAKYGSVITFTAQPDEGHQFLNWTLNGEVVSTDPTYVVTALSDMNVVANFSSLPILIEVEESEGGHIEGLGTGIYEHHANLTLTAVPDEDYVLKEWLVDGEAVGETGETLKLQADKPMTIKAIFEQEFYRQTMTLARGWNWVSSYISEPWPMDYMSSYANRIVGQFNERISDPVYGMVGGLEQLSSGSAYKVEAAERFSVNFRGHLLTAPITLKKGWNWVAYPWMNNTLVSNVITNAEEGDYLVGQRGFTEYADGYWEGTLRTLTPGNGYLYKSASEKTLGYDFTQTAGSRGSAPAYGSVQSANDAIDMNAYPNTMNVTARLYQDGAEIKGDHYVLYAMSGDELRGVAEYVGSNYYLTVYGDKPVAIGFVVENVNTGNTYVANESIVFHDDVVGSRKQPFAISIGNATGIETIDDLRIDDLQFVYDLQGRRLSESAIRNSGLKKGVYIVNGHKVVNGSSNMPGLSGKYVNK